MTSSLWTCYPLYHYTVCVSTSTLYWITNNTPTTDTSSSTPFLHQMPFLLQPSQFILACDSYQVSLAAGMHTHWLQNTNDNTTANDPVKYQRHQISLYTAQNNTSSCVNIFLTCRKQPSAISKSSSNVRPLNTGWGAFSKNLMNGKSSCIFSTSACCIAQISENC